MVINWKRNFSYNGRHYSVVDLSENEKATYGKRYGLMYKPDGDDFWHVAQGIGYEELRFNTIKEAKRYVEGWDFLIGNCFI